MDGKDVNVYLHQDIMSGPELVKMMKDNSEMMLGVLIASRRTMDGEKCNHCKRSTSSRDLIHGCYKVPGMEDLGCAMCVTVNGGIRCDK